MLRMNAVGRIAATYGPPEGVASVRRALRVLRDGGTTAAPDALPLERTPGTDEPPRLERATLIEGAMVRAHQLPDGPVTGIGAFLDGVQRTRLLAWQGSVPLVHGAVGAAIRIRRERRLGGWGPGAALSQSLFVPLARLDAPLRQHLEASLALVDTLRDGEEGSEHPQDLLARARTAVERERESHEIALAEQWVAREATPMLIDGGLGSSRSAARSEFAIGLVKSHRTLYLAGESMPTLLALHAEERSSAVELHSPRRAPVASWYLRLREPVGRSPLFGLVRVEIARDAFSPERADLVSRWLLAERSPVALPDPRWDVLVYGIHECERYLNSLLR